MVGIEIEIVSETEIGIVIGMVVVVVAAAPAADEMMTTDRENDTTKVMGMMTREAKEGIETRYPSPPKNR